jgi:hypothetical protein
VESSFAGFSLGSRVADLPARGLRAREEPATKEQITTNSDFRKEKDASAAMAPSRAPAAVCVAVEAEPLRA